MRTRQELLGEKWAHAVEGRDQRDYQPDLPPLEGAAYLLGILYEVGPLMSYGTGAGPVTQQEIRAWQDNIGIELQPWEVRLLRGLSQEYLAESRRATEPGSKPPWIAPRFKLAPPAA